MYSKAKQAVHVVIEGVFCVKAAQHLELLFSVSFFFFYVLRCTEGRVHLRSSSTFFLLFFFFFLLTSVLHYF